MQEKQARLKQLFARMDSAQLTQRTQDPQLTPMARALALAELQARANQPQPVAPEASAPADAAQQPGSGLGASKIALYALAVLLCALLFKQLDLAVLGGVTLLILLSRLLPTAGAVFGLALLLSPLWFWLAGGFDSGNWLVNCILIFFSLIAAGTGLAMLESVVSTESDSDFWRRLAEKTRRAQEILKDRRR